MGLSYGNSLYSHSSYVFIYTLCMPTGVYVHLIRCLRHCLKTALKYCYLMRVGEANTPDSYNLKVQRQEELYP